MSQNEIAVMDGGKCILSLRGVRPFLSSKFGIMKHPRYKYMSDYDKENAFDPEKYLSRLRRATADLKPDDVFIVVEAGADTQDMQPQNG